MDAVFPWYQCWEIAVIGLARLSAYVWPWSKEEVRGHRIEPLYPKVPEAASMDSKLYEMLALIDAFRVGRAREKNLGIIELKKRIIGGEQGS